MSAGVQTSTGCVLSADQGAVSARIGAVSYLNTVPLVAGLENLRDLRLTLAPPNQLAVKLAAGEVDLALAPIIESQRLPIEVALAPVGIIGAPGETLTVRLFSRVPLEAITEVHADIESRTSVALAQVILKRRLGRTPTFVAFDARKQIDCSPENSWPETMLLIGDKVVRASIPSEQYAHQLDLGEAWRTLTGLPFVYATWMCDASRIDSPEVRLALAVLDRQRRHNATRLDWLVTTQAPAHDWPVDLARTYIGERLQYDISDDHRRAVDLFFDEAYSVGAIAARRSTVWAEV